MSRKGWLREEHVLAGPVADLLRKAISEERQTREDFGCQINTSRAFWEACYAERYAVNPKTAARHFKLVLSQPSVPVLVADRISALVGVPLAYLEAVS